MGFFPTAADEVSLSKRLSMDPEARWLNQSGCCRFGCKGFLRTDGDDSEGDST